jgi:predicted enzyme related to lactoylglutathione lyase
MRPTNQNGHFQSIGSARWFFLPRLSISRSSVRLKAAGVEFVEAPTDCGNATIAPLKDPEGNLLQLLQFARPS